MAKTFPGIKMNLKSRSYRHRKKSNEYCVESEECTEVSDFCGDGGRRQ
jgi:hypothetical protein